MAGPFYRNEIQNVMVTLSMMNGACQYKYVTATRPVLKRFAAFFLAVRGILGYFKLRRTGPPPGWDKPGGTPPPADGDSESMSKENA